MFNYFMRTSDQCQNVLKISIKSAEKQTKSNFGVYTAVRTLGMGKVSTDFLNLTQDSSS